MRIGIDMRMAGTMEGISRYTRLLVDSLSKIDESTTYVLIFHDQSRFAKAYQPPAKNFVKVYVRSPYYSVMEQLFFPFELYKLRLDLVHFVSFNAPYLYFRPFVVTIHDLIHHHFPGRKKRNLLYRIGYKLVISGAINRARKVISVSNFTKSEIVSKYGVPENKVDVVYNGVGEEFFYKLDQEEVNKVKVKYKLKKPYVLFVGVWRVYKNLERLSEAFSLLKKDYSRDLQLVLVGKPDRFHPEIKKKIFSSKNARDIIPTGAVPESDLFALYQGATVFVLPSLLEGFGLIGVEAQASGVPVVASDIPVLQEVLGEGALFFDPTSTEMMAQTLNLVLMDESLARRIAQIGLLNAKQFTWENTAKSTLSLYKQIINSTK